MGKKTHTVETIDCTPTWSWACSVYVQAIRQNPTGEAFDNAYKGLQEMAVAAQAANDVLASLKALVAVCEKQLDQSVTDEGLTNCNLLAQSRSLISKFKA